MNWPWSAPQPAVPPPPSPVEELPEPAQERLARLEAQFSQMQLEWADTLDKITRWAGKMAARERQRLHRDLAAAESAQEAPGDTNGEGGDQIPPQNRKAALRSFLAQKRRA